MNAGKEATDQTIEAAARTDQNLKLVVQHVDNINQMTETNLFGKRLSNQRFLMK